MPELPEVETIVRRLRPLLKNRSIREIEVRRKKSFQGDPKQVIGLKIKDIVRRAKVIRIYLSRGDSSGGNLVIHLKMTGQLIFVGANQKRIGGGHPTADWVHKLPSKHTRVILKFDNGATLYFNDMRVFGWIRFMTDKEANQYLSQYAPDVIDKIITPQSLYKLLQRHSITIKQAIMDTKIMSGIGNIYACDGLNLAGIDPRREARSLTLAEVSRLLQALRQVVNLGIKLEGATIDTYVKADGLAGGYQDVMRVYGKEGQDCPSCKGKIKRIKQAGRSTFFCEACQV